MTTDTAVSNDTPANPFAKPNEAEASIVDTILDLDEFLSGDVRLAETTAYFYTEPQLEAEIAELEEQLAAITDENGRPIDPAAGDVSIADGRHLAYDLADQITALRARYQASRKGIRVRQMPSDEWAAFKELHRAAFKANSDSGTPLPEKVWDELIVACAIRPAFTSEKVKGFRAMVGEPQFAVISLACWNVCTKSGVSVPKSPLSSLVLRHQAREKN